MENQSLKNALDELRKELAETEMGDGPERTRLLELIASLEARSQGPKGDDAEETSLADHVRESVGHFETEHPRLTSILIEIMTTLGGAGI